jgi:hypothetical protein
VDYESLAPIKEKFAIYADKFDPFALESNAMSQYLGMSLYPGSKFSPGCQSNNSQFGWLSRPRASVPTSSTTAL